MAKLKIAPIIVEDSLFGSSENPVFINKISYDENNDYYIFDVSGKDIPECEEIMCEVSVEVNRINTQRLMKMKFVKIK
jgi:hypothetical protein